MHEINHTGSLLTTNLIASGKLSHEISNYAVDGEIVDTANLLLEIKPDDIE